MVTRSIFIIFGLFQSIFLHPMESVENLLSKDKLVNDFTNLRTSCRDKIKNYYGLSFETELEGRISLSKELLKTDVITVNEATEAYQICEKDFENFKPEDDSIKCEFEKYAKFKFSEVKNDIETSCKISFGQWSCDQTLSSEILYRTMSKELISIYNYMVEIDNFITCDHLQRLLFPKPRFTQQSNFYENFGFFAFDKEKSFKDILAWFSDSNHITDLKQSLIQFSCVCSLYLLSKGVKDELDEVDLLKKKLPGYSFTSRLASIIEYINEVNQYCGYQQQYNISLSLSTLDQFRLVYLYHTASTLKGFILAEEPDQEIVINKHSIKICKSYFKKFESWMNVHLLPEGSDDTNKSVYCENNTYQTKYYKNLHSKCKTIVSELRDEKQRYFKLKEAFNTIQILFPEIDDQGYIRSISNAFEILLKKKYVQKNHAQNDNFHSDSDSISSKIEKMYSTLNTIKQELSVRDYFKDRLAEQYKLNQTMKTFFGDQVEVSIKGDHFVGIIFLRSALINFLYAFHFKNYEEKDFKKYISFLAKPYNKKLLYQVEMQYKDINIFILFFKNVLIFLDWLNVSNEVKTPYHKWVTILTYPKVSWISINGPTQLRSFLYESFDQIIDWCTIKPTKVTISGQTFKDVIKGQQKTISTIFDNQNVRLKKEMFNDTLLPFHIEISAKECERYIEQIASLGENNLRSESEKAASKMEYAELEKKIKDMGKKYTGETNLIEFAKIACGTQDATILAEEDRKRQTGMTVITDSNTKSSSTVNTEAKKQDISSLFKRFLCVCHLLNDTIEETTKKYFFFSFSLIFGVYLTLLLDKELRQTSFHLTYFLFSKIV